MLFAILIMASGLLGVYAGSFSVQQADSLLINYNVPASLIAALQPVYLNYSGNEYMVLYKGTIPYFVINISSQSFVTNASSIYNIIRNYTFTSSYSKLNFSVLASQMHAYENSSAVPISDCLQETGLSSGVNCTLSNHCASCQGVPVCRAVLDNTSGPSGVFGSGIMKFESQYNQLNSSYAQFYASLKGINKTNVLVKIASLESAFRNISNLTQTISQNPIFPANLTSSMFSTCINYQNSTSAPWFCFSLGFCEFTTFNYSLLNKMQSELNAINSTPLSDQAIFSLAANSSSTELGYIFPVLSRQKLKELEQTVATELSGYNATVANAEQLLNEVNDSELEVELSNLEKAYAQLSSSYLTENISKQAAYVSSLLAAFTANYSALNKTYSSVLATAGNNTAKILKAQLTNPNQPGLYNIAFQELGLNRQLETTVGNVIALQGSLLEVSSKLKPYSTSSISLVEFARAVDGAFARPLLYVLHTSYAKAVALAPLFGALLSFIIGITFLLALVFLRSYLKLKKKIVDRPKTVKNWHRLYLLVLLLIAVYVVATYALLAYANSYAPFSAFSSALQNSRYVVIAINGTPTLNAYSCASKIGAEASSLGKQPLLISLSNGNCIIGNTTKSYDYCMNYFAGINAPMIVLTNSTSEGMSLYSLYGTVLNYMGNATAIQACYPSLMLN
ncbi:MAG: hypothetical protein ACP5T4_02220 [Candidatus Micrarchaeia archaeon]